MSFQDPRIKGLRIISPDGLDDGTGNDKEKEEGKMSPRISLEMELAALEKSVAEMAAKVLENYDALFEAYEQGEEEKIAEIAKIDKEIGNKQREIESKCLFLITRQQPVAGDLRVVTAALKAVTDLERIGDHVSDMAELLLRIKKVETQKLCVHLIPMTGAAREMIQLAVDAFLCRNESAAKEVIAADDIVDELFNKVKNDLLETLKNTAGNADEWIDLLMIAKYLEKIGDHAVNIGEWELFKETGNMGNMRLL